MSVNMSCVKTFLLVTNLIGYFSILTAIPFTINKKHTIDSYINFTCPTDKPFIKKNGTESICVSTCGPTMVADGINCIKVEDCKKPVLSDGKCMEMCDEGYLYITFDHDLAYYCDADCSYTSKNIGQKLCEKKKDLILKMAGYVVGIILYIVFMLMFFSTRRFPCTQLMTWIKVKNQMKRTSSRDVLVCNDDVQSNEFSEN